MPKLPRGRGLKLDGPMLFRIGATLVLLVMIILMRRPCADATSKFVTGFGADGSGSSAVVPKPGTIDLPAGSGSAKPIGDGMEHVGPTASEEEVRAAWERAKARAAAGSGSAEGSGSASVSGSGSAVGSSSASGLGSGSGSGSAR